MTHLGNLISSLRSVNISAYQKLFRYETFLRSYTSPDWNNFVNQKNINLFQKNLVHRDKQFEIFLINWPIDYQSQIHNHAEYGCLLKVLKGGLQERIYHPNLDLLDVKDRNCNSISYLDDSIGYHRVRNTNITNSVSLHIYSPPFHSTQYFDNN